MRYLYVSIGLTEVDLFERISRLSADRLWIIEKMKISIFLAITGGSLWWNMASCHNLRILRLIGINDKLKIYGSFL